MLVSDYPYMLSFCYPQFTVSNAICMFAVMRQLNDYQEILTNTKIKGFVDRIRERKYIKDQDLQRVPPQCLETLVQLLDHMECKKVSWRIARQFETLIDKQIQFITHFCKRGNHGKPLMDNPEWPIMWLGTPVLQITVEFQRRFYNALFGIPTSCPLQLLDLNEEQIKIIRQKPVIHIKEEILSSREKMEEFVKRFPGEDRQKYIMKQIENYPRLTLEVKCVVEDQVVTKMTTTDVATFEFKITKNETAGYCALKNYPFLKEEDFYFMFIFNGNLIHFAHVHMHGKNEFKGSFQYQQDFPK